MSELAEAAPPSSISLGMPGRQAKAESVQLGALFAITVVMLILRLALLNSSGLWADEVFSLAIATGHSLEHAAFDAQPELGDFVEPDRPVAPEELNRYVKHQIPLETPARVVRATWLSDTSPPLYYLLLYCWTILFATSDTALRSFSILCSLACLPFMVSVARRTGGKNSVMPACLLFAVSPLSIYYSTEGRMYSLLILCVAAVASLSLGLHQRGGGIGFYLLWVLASAAGFLTHYFFVFPWLAMVAFLTVRPGKSNRRDIFGCIFATGIAILPWYGLIPGSLRHWRLTQGWLRFEPGGFSRWRQTRDCLMQFFSGRGFELWTYDRLSTVAALILFALIAAGFIWRLRLRVLTERTVFLLLWFFVVCAGPIVIDLTQHTYLVAKPRYAIAALPAAYLLAGTALACLPVTTRMVLLSSILAAWLPTTLKMYRNPLPWLPMRELAQVATASSNPSDLVLVHSIPSGVINIARYVTGPAAMAPWVGQLQDRRVPESLQQLAAGRTRILFLKVHDAGEPAPEETWLRANAVAVDEKHLGAGVVVDFRPKIGGIF